MKEPGTGTSAKFSSGRDLGLAEDADGVFDFVVFDK